MVEEEGVFVEPPPPVFLWFCLCVEECTPGLVLTCFAPAPAGPPWRFDFSVDGPAVADLRAFGFLFALDTGGLGAMIAFGLVVIVGVVASFVDGKYHGDCFSTLLGFSFRRPSF